MLVAPLAAAFSFLVAALGPSLTVERVRDLSYASDGADAHRLDLYLPEDRSHASLIVYVHGGAFLSGDRRDASAVGSALAREGLATAVVSYRLSPTTDADGATRDVALAVAWAIRHVGAYGIDTRNLFLVGHSAGAQIVALIGTNAAYLARSDVPLSAVRGVIPVAGAYDVRDLSGEPDSWQAIDGQIYGETPQRRSLVSPSLHIDSHTPPMQISCGTEDDPWSCERAGNLARALRTAGRDATVIRVVGADHMGMLRELVDPKEALNARLLDFIERCSLV